jgi:hypothetical protein
MSGLALAGAVLLGAAVVPATANAAWHGGGGRDGGGWGGGGGRDGGGWGGGGWGDGGLLFDFVPPPIYVGPPPFYYDYPPPVYYAPPPAYYAPPPAQVAPAPGTACYAGPYVCPLARALPIDSPCTCPTDNGRIAGQTH